MVLSQMQLAYLYYELFMNFLIALQNYKITAFANLRLSSLKHQKVEKTTTTK